VTVGLTIWTSPTRLRRAFVLAAVLNFHLVDGSLSIYPLTARKPLHAARYMTISAAQTTRQYASKAVRSHTGAARNSMK